MSEAIYYDGWHTCATCGADKGGMDLWQDTCPRCAELAALEREIGRLEIGEVLRFRAQDIIENDSWSEDSWRASRWVEDQRLDYYRQRRELIARWRELHAAGAEEGR